MKFSMNGFRRQLSSNVDELRGVAESIIKDEYYDKEDFVAALNEVITNSNVINCTFDRENPDFTDMSDLEIDHLVWQD